jgi:uncharacterized RDD family membrane protein YckC
MVAAGETMGRFHADPRLRYANFESRFVAAVLDTLVLFIIAAVMLAIAGLVLLISSDFGEIDPSDSAYYTFVGILIGVLPLWALYFFFSWAWRGQTIGDAIMQITVLRSNGAALGLTGAFARLIAVSAYLLIIGGGLFIAYLRRDSSLEVALFITGSLLIALAGVLWAAFDSEHRALHDRIAGTIVVRPR